MCIKIIELNKKNLIEYDVKEFLFKMIKLCYGLDYVPNYHYDIVNLKRYYIEPDNCTFFIAINDTTNEIIATSAIRSYDGNYNIPDRFYNSINTASIHRVFVNPEYRHQKIATNLIKCIEKFCMSKNYKEIYLHTQKNSYGALHFWLYNDFKITFSENDLFSTIHMEKRLGDICEN